MVQSPNPVSWRRHTFPICHSSEVGKICIRSWLPLSRCLHFFKVYIALLLTHRFAVTTSPAGHHSWWQASFLAFGLMQAAEYVLCTYLTYHVYTLCIHVTIYIFSRSSAMTKVHPPTTMLHTTSMHRGSSDFVLEISFHITRILWSNKLFFNVKINHFRGDLTDFSALKRLSVYPRQCRRAVLPL